MIADLSAGGFLTLIGATDDDYGYRLNQWRDHLKESSEKLRDAWSMFSGHKHELSGSDKHEVFSGLRQAQEELDRAWEEYKRRRAEYSDAQREAFEHRHQDFIDRVEANIDKLSTRLDRLYEIVRRKEENIENNEARLADARSDAFRERVSGWIAEDQDDLRGLRDQVDQVEGWLEEAREKLRSAR